MNVLVTGAKGFVGMNLCAALRNISEGKDRTRPNIKIGEIYEYDIDTDEALLDEYCRRADFVFNLAGVNRPKARRSTASVPVGLAAIMTTAAGPMWRVIPPGKHMSLRWRIMRPAPGSAPGMCPGRGTAVRSCASTAWVV